MSKIRKSARGQECLVRVPGLCNANPQTVILAHVPGGGIGAKAPDIHGAYACSACHDAIDGRIQTEFSRETLRLWHLEGVLRTQESLIENGLITF